MEQDRLVLVCPDCSNVEQCGYSQMLARLQQVGVLRRTTDPEPDLVCELFESTVARFACANCGQVGLTAREASDDWEGSSLGRRCEVCGQSIPTERLEVFPDTKLCATCQRKDETGADVTAEYCPRCGEVMTMRLDSRGTSRYVMACPKCGSPR